MQKHWAGFLNAVASTPIPQTSKVAPYPNTDSSTGKTGFLDIFPRSTSQQGKYDAMSGSWAGVDASNKAVSQGLFKSDSAPVEKQQ
jgi:hypothetical protein